MAIGSGLGSQVGFSTEATSWGTRTAPAKFVRATAYAANRPSNRVQGEGLQAGVIGQIGAHYVEVTEAGEGSISLDMQTSGLGPLLQALTGGTSTITQQVTSAEFSCSADSILTGTFNFDAKKWDNSQTMATASYTTARPFHGKQMSG